MILEKSKIYNDVEDIIKYDKYSIFLELLKIKKEFEELKSKNGLMIDRIISDINNTEIYINDLDITNDDISFIISMQELEDIFSKKDKKVLNDYKLVSNYKLEEYIDFYDEKMEKDTGICVGSDYSGGFCFQYVCRCGGVLQHQSGTTQGIHRTGR